MTKELKTGGPAFPNDSGDDRDNNGMTTRTYAAIHLKVPMSEHNWLNDMIRESQRMELAKAAMAYFLEPASGAKKLPTLPIFGQTPCSQDRRRKVTDRDPFWDALKQHKREKFDADRAAFKTEAEARDDGGWTKHTEYHWSRMLDGKRLDYWPSRRKFQYEGKVRRGDVMKLIREKGNG